MGESLPVAHISSENCTVFLVETLWITVKLSTKFLTNVSEFLFFVHYVSCKSSCYLSWVETKKQIENRNVHWDVNTHQTQMGNLLTKKFNYNFTGCVRTPMSSTVLMGWKKSGLGCYYVATLWQYVIKPQLLKFSLLYQRRSDAFLELRHGFVPVFVSWDNSCNTSTCFTRYLSNNKFYYKNTATPLSI